MSIFLEEHQNFLKKLLQNKVEFILVGGIAVIYYGYPRTTGDLDIWLKPTSENKEKLLTVLKADKVFEEDIEYLNSLDFTQSLVFHIGEEPEKIDFLTQISGVKYSDADELKQFFTIEDTQIPIIHLNP